MTKTIACDKCNGRGYFTFESSGSDYAGVTVLRCEVCQGKGTIDVPITNADHIRAMTDEELAAFLEEIDSFNCECCVHQMNCRFEHDTETVDYTEKYNCIEGRMDWLRQPYEEDT